MNSYDFAVIGAGPGGYVSAIRAGQLGLKTVLIEKGERLGGTCLNIGCVPSKALLESSEIYANAEHNYASHGISTDSLSFNLSQMMNRKEQVVNQLTDGLKGLMRKNKVTVMHGEGNLIGQGQISVDLANGSKETVESKNIVLATGSYPSEIPFMKFNGKTIISSTEALTLESVPDHLIVIGGGAIGLEIGSVWRRLGANVSVIEMLPRIVPFSDKQISIMLQRYLKEISIEFHMSAKVVSVEINGEMLDIAFEGKDGSLEHISGDKVLVAVGRQPNSRSASIHEAGVRIDDSGFVMVNKCWETNIEGIYAIGDLIGNPMLAHKAEEEGIAVAEIAAGMDSEVNYDVIPSVVYTFPELASVGLTEEEAKLKEIDYQTGRFFFRGNSRALSMGETDGLIKILAERQSGKIIGAHILGPHASELISEVVTAMEMNATAEQIARTVHAHPTLSEAVKEAAMSVNKRQIHA